MSDEKDDQVEEKDEAAKAGSDADESVESKDADADSDTEADEAADQAAIARRVAALGEEDESEKLAREEERKLAERRKAGKKGKKKRGGGLEVAASKKLEKIGKRAEPKRRDVSVAADADPLIDKTVKLSDWAKQNQKLVQRVGALIAVALIGLAGWMYWDHKRETEASMALGKAVETQHAQIGEPPKDEDDNAIDDGPFFKTAEERREKALEKYREVEKKYSGTGAAILARLSEASLLLDKRDADGAAAAFTEVKGSALGQADKEVKGRALEGLGFAYELKAEQAEGADAKKPFWDQALQTYKELENTVDVRGFKEMAIYHQARVQENKGDKEEAKKLLLVLKDKFDKGEDSSAMPGTPGGQSFPYLREVAMDRLRGIDPEAAPKIQGMPGGGAQVLPPHIRKMLEDQQKKAAGGGDPHGH